MKVFLRAKRQGKSQEGLSFRRAFLIVLFVRALPTILNGFGLELLGWTLDCLDSVRPCFRTPALP